MLKCCMSVLNGSKEEALEGVQQDKEQKRANQKGSKGFQLFSSSRLFRGERNSIHTAQPEFVPKNSTKLTRNSPEEPEKSKKQENPSRNALLPTLQQNAIFEQKASFAITPVPLNKNSAQKETNDALLVMKKEPDSQINKADHPISLENNSSIMAIKHQNESLLVFDSLVSIGQELERDSPAQNNFILPHSIGFHSSQFSKESYDWQNEEKSQSIKYIIRDSKGEVSFG